MMGYIHDALNRANDDNDDRRAKRDSDGSIEGPSGQAEQNAQLSHKLDPNGGPKGPGVEAPAEIFSDPTGNGPDQPSTYKLNPGAYVNPGDVAGRAFDGVRTEGIDDRLVALTEPASLMSEEYRAIRTGIMARWEHRRNLVHTITSAAPQEGKTITSLNLGLSFAELRNRRTVVIEADLRLPQFTRLFNLPTGPGLVNVLQDEAELLDATVEVGPLHLIAAGGRANDRAAQLLHSSRMVSLLEQLRQRYDHVIIDTPPVIELADAGILGAMSDELILIVRMGHTPRTLVDQAVRTLASCNAPVAGVLATDQPRRQGRYYKYGYQYRYRYTEKQSA